MAETKHSATAAHEPQAERELKIDLRPYGWQRWDFEGTRAQLEAEGVIPPGTVWPETGTKPVCWTAGPLKYHLQRKRPDGMKGPMRLWVNGDWWCLVCTPAKGEDVLQQSVNEARRELERLTRLQTPEGQRAVNRLCARAAKADFDSAFQAFKALVPGLVPPRRGGRALS